MLFECWASVEDGGPTFKQHWVNASCLLGSDLGIRRDLLSPIKAVLLFYPFYQHLKNAFSKLKLHQDAEYLWSSFNKTNTSYL